MLPVLITILVYLIIGGLIWWLVHRLPLPVVLLQIIDVLLVIILILLILSLFNAVPGLAPIRLL